tara:strand:+ start:181 stop:597 length:417 start_codon:yes stop_codon:yes gene_type:complete
VLIFCGNASFSQASVLKTKESAMKKEEIVEQLATGRMSRRQFNKNLMALGATMVMMPMGSQNAQAGSVDHPTVFTWEGWEVPELHSAYVLNMVGLRIYQFLQMKKKLLPRCVQVLKWILPSRAPIRSRFGMMPVLFYR